MTAQRFEVPRWECLNLLETDPVGRLCCIDHGYPIALPVNYRMVRDRDEVRFVIRTSPDTRLGQYEGLSSLEVDNIDLASGSAWSVVVRGNLHRADNPLELPDPDPLVTESRTRWLVLESTAISGRQFRVAKPPTGHFVEWQMTEV